MDLALQRDFTISPQRLRVYLWLSLLWLGLGEVSMVSVGWLLAVHYVGTTYETTFLRSLISGWRPLAMCTGAALIGHVLGPRLLVHLNSRTGSFGIALRLFALE